MPRSVIAVVALAVAAVLVPQRLAGGQHVTLTLDWTPNPDHVGFYYARDDRALRARPGSTSRFTRLPTRRAPLKLVAVGASDLAVSYEQEVFFAAAEEAAGRRGRRGRAAAAQLDHGDRADRCRRVADLRGRSVGITGVPSDYATLDTALALGRPAAQGRQDRQRRLQPAPGAARPRSTPYSASTATSKGSSSQQRGLHPDDHPGQPRRRSDLRRARARREHDAARGRPRLPLDGASIRGGASSRARRRRAQTPAAVRSQILAQGHRRRRGRSSTARHRQRSRCSPGPTASAACARPSGSDSAPGCTARGLLKARIPASPHRRHELPAEALLSLTRRDESPGARRSRARCVPPAPRRRSRSRGSSPARASRHAADRRVRPSTTPSAGPWTANQRDELARAPRQPTLRSDDVHGRVVEHRIDLDGGDTAGSQAAPARRAGGRGGRRRRSARASAGARR